MGERVTLELPENIARRAKETAQQTGQSLEGVLTAWLERGADAVPTLLPGAEYPIFTPYGNEDAAEALLRALNESKI
jgi:hypothetical protein